MAKNRLDFTQELAYANTGLNYKLAISKTQKTADELASLVKQLKSLTAAKKIPKALLKTGILQYENKVRKELTKKVKSLIKTHKASAEYMDYWEKRNVKFIQSMMIKMVQK